MNENDEAVELLKSLLSAVNDLSKSATLAMAAMIEGKAPLNTAIIRLVKFKHACVIFSAALETWLDECGEDIDFKIVNNHGN